MNPVESKNKLLSRLSASLSDSPGVYLMKNERGDILYVGKAKNLKKRLRSYFTGVKDIKTRQVLSKTEEIETFVTGSEAEAFLLENNLIKHWKPKYNINLKDGKTYPVIRLTGETYPRLYRTRRIVFDGSKYFGPFPKAGLIDVYLDLVDKLFPLRKCKGPLRERAHPCLNYHIGRCSAPCCGIISREEYLERVEKVRRLLSGRTGELLRELGARMDQSAAAQEYEKAGSLRDQIRAIQELEAEQKVVDFRDEAADYIGLATEQQRTGAAVLQVRAGRLVGRELFLFEDYAPEQDSAAHFLSQYYSGRENLPGTVYLSPSGAVSPPGEPSSSDLLAGFLSTLSGTRVRVRFPRKGKHAQLARMAAEAADRKLAGAGAPAGLLEALQRALGLKAPPRRIEGFDIAHLGGEQTVASLVCFEDGCPRKSEYRHYTVKTLNGAIDDFEAIREVVARRYTRLANEGGKLPDLILIDGGRGQVSSALSILRALGLEKVPVAGLAKRNEEVFLPQRREPLLLPEASPELRLLQAVRNEAHRFATSFHKRLRDKRVRSSLLESIRGIGPKRSRLLLERYGSIQEMRARSPEELSEALRISPEQASDLLVRLGQLGE